MLYPIELRAQLLKSTINNVQNAIKFSNALSTKFGYQKKLKLSLPAEIDLSM
jgi:hypothetical protein